MRRFFALTLAALMLLTLASCNKAKPGGDDAEKEPVVSANDAALESENFSISMAELTYIFYRNYNDLRYGDAETFDMYNIDPDKSLKKQEYHDGITWYDYFCDAAVEHVTFVLTFCEDAKANSIELDDSDREQIDKVVKTWTDYASAYDYTEKELFERDFNSDVSTDVIRSYLEKEMLAQKAYERLVGAYSFTDDEMTAFVEENHDQFYSINYIKYTLDEDSDDNALAHSEELAAISDPDEFASYIDNHITNVAAYDGGEVTLDSCYVNYAAKNEGSDFSKWAFDKAALYSTYTESNDVDGRYTVYMLTGLPSLQEYKTRNILYLTESINGHDSYKETMDYVNGLLNEWKEAGATEESFAAMAEGQNDTGTGGEIKLNIAKSSTGLPEGLTDWLFAEERAVGDTTVLKGYQEYMAAYYSGEGEVQWKVLAKQGLSDKKYTEDYEKLSKKYPTTVNETVTDGINA